MSKIHTDAVGGENKKAVLAAQILPTDCISCLNLGHTCFFQYGKHRYFCVAFNKEIAIVSIYSGDFLYGVGKIYPFLALKYKYSVARLIPVASRMSLIGMSLASYIARAC